MIKRQSMFYKSVIFILFLLVHQMIAAQSSTSCDTSLLNQIEKAKEAYEAANYTEAKELALCTLKNLGRNKDKLLCVADLYSVLGNISILNGVNKYETAQEYYLHELSLRQKLGEKGTESIAIASFNLGACNYYLGSYEKSKEYLEKSLDIFLSKDIYELSDVYFSELIRFLSEVYWFSGEKNRAEELLQKKVWPRLNKIKFDRRLIGYYASRGYNYYLNKEYQKSIDFQIKAVTLYKKHLPNELGTIFNTTRLIGSVYVALGNTDKAIKYYEEAFDIAKQNNFPKLAYSLIYNMLGNTYRKKEDFVTSLDYYKKSLRFHTPTNTYEDSDKIPKSEELYDHYPLIMSILKSKFYVLREIYKHSKDSSYLTQSINTFKLADTLLSNQYRKFQFNNDVLTSNALHNLEVYSGLISSYFDIYNKTKTPKSFNQMLFYSEKNRGLVLNQSTIRKTLKLNSFIPKVILKKQQNIETDISQKKSSFLYYKDKNDSVSFRKVKKEIFSLNLKKDSLESVIRKQYPKYHQLTYDNTIISVKEIQNKLSKNATLLEYFVADSTTYAFTIFKDEYSVSALDIDSLEDTITQFNNAIIAKDAENYNELAYSLYQKLIVPVQHTLKGEELIIVPDGPLWHLNFDLLLTKESTSEAYQELPYFLKEKVISYANSANLLFNQVYDEQKKNIKECLAFSFADTTKTDQGSTMDLATLRNTDDDLPGTRKEIKAISEIINGKYYYGKEAIEDNFKSNAANYNILHLALHGEVDNEHPENSKLFFTKNKDSIEDNYLYNHELYAMDIPAELVVLSACNTGTGKVAKGEGIMSLGRAFQYAGAKSLVLTNWEVSDETTPILMRNFYANLKQGMNKAKALQQAKLQYLHTANVYNSDPFYWGGFYLIGDTAAIDFQNNLSHWYWLSLFLVLLSIILGFWFFRQKRKRS
ncbi:CHAT domain-containing tetratricopeptide repeat protein [uncultured Aquimarina sp.]|uniref:CHAT domain-containing protein n=1 Tax=uncultured Aquimarina sp. TaxID=575652 RepID=UPI0026204B5B|nr:CHAT domain-containing tetratricopeptide repeat protein [uncultured Aquimarina sp.]